MKSTHYNRYKDTITFAHENNTVTMTGHNPEWMRYGYANDYTDAYHIYLNQCKALTEPDYFYLVEDNNENKLRPMTYQEFAHEVNTNNDYTPYLKYVTSDTDTIDMVDPSGGPYIQVGTNLKMFFDDHTDRIVQHITINNDSVIFTLEEEHVKKD